MSVPQGSLHCFLEYLSKIDGTTFWEVDIEICIALPSTVGFGDNVALQIVGTEDGLLHLRVADMLEVHGKRLVSAGTFVDKDEPHVTHKHVTYDV